MDKIVDAVMGSSRMTKNTHSLLRVVSRELISSYRGVVMQDVLASQPSRSSIFLFILGLLGLMWIITFFLNFFRLDHILSRKNNTDRPQ